MLTVGGLKVKAISVLTVSIKSDMSNWVATKNPTHNDHMPCDYCSECIKCLLGLTLILWFTVQLFFLTKTASLLYEKKKLTHSYSMIISEQCLLGRTWTSACHACQACSYGVCTRPLGTRRDVHTSSPPKSIFVHIREIWNFNFGFLDFRILIDSIPFYPPSASRLLEAKCSFETLACDPSPRLVPSVPSNLFRPNRLNAVAVAPFL